MLLYIVVVRYLIMQKVKSISEAFSMQPITLQVVSEKKRSKFDPSQDIEKIELEVMDENTNVYVGYNFDGEKKFQYLANAVNVHYF